jgi:hypothetical protein
MYGGRSKDSGSSRRASDGELGSVVLCIASILEPWIGKTSEVAITRTALCSPTTQFSDSRSEYNP